MGHIVKIISEQKQITHTEYKREFNRIGETDFSGFSFPCDEQGNINTKDSNYTLWKENYEYCLSHPLIFEDLGVNKYTWEYTEPSIAKCSCGNEFPLQSRYMGACNCSKCGQWYNVFGQELLDPEYWGNTGRYL